MDPSLRDALIAVGVLLLAAISVTLLTK